MYRKDLGFRSLLAQGVKGLGNFYYWLSGSIPESMGQGIEIHALLLFFVVVVVVDY